MAQIFHRSMNTLARLSILGGAFTAAGVRDGLVYLYNQLAASTTNVRVGQATSRCRSATSTTSAGLGIDCRYCHTTVETTAYLRASRRPTPA